MRTNTSAVTRALAAIDAELARDTALFRFESLAEFVQQPAGSEQIRGLDPGSAIVVAFGPPKGGKTFTMCDVAMHAACGRDWHGFEIPKALRVAYLAGEGIRGLRVRLKAWQEHHDTCDPSENFVILGRAFSLPENASAVIASLRPFAPDVVVADTLNAFFGAGSENDTEAMTNFVGSIRRIRDELGTSVWVIHHTGHGDQSRERGSIVLRASADVLAQVARDSNGSGDIAFQVIAARDLETMDSPLALRLRRVETAWRDETGAPLSSCVVEASETPVALPGRGARPLGDAQAQILQIVQELAARPGGDLIARCDVTTRAKELGVDRRRVSQAWAPLASRGLIRLLEPGTVQLVRS